MSEFNSAQGSSWQIPTPRGEEAERLDYYYNRADELCLMAEARQVTDEEYCRMAQRLDDEGVGEYFRALCDFHSFPNTRPRLALHPLLRGVLPVVLPAEAGRPAKKKVQAGLRTSRRRPSAYRSPLS
jgi:hypothetical protein